MWNFGDGTTSTSQNPVHTYSNDGKYDLYLTVSNNQGCSAYTKKPQYINVKKSPAAKFSVSADKGCAPLKIICSNSSVGAVKYFWDFGDGDTSSLKDPVHVYPDGGKYKITLRAIGSNDCEHAFTYSKDIVVEQGATGFTADITSGCSPLAVNFKPAFSSAGNYTWNFGDGTTDSSMTPTHIYTGLGTYSVRLTVSTPLGCKDSIVLNNYIRMINPGQRYTPPAPSRGCVPYTTDFSDATPGASGWLWDFGDNTSSILQSPQHTYTQPGVYVVTLTVKTANGCDMVISKFKTIEVSSIAAGFTYSLPACSNYTVPFTDTTANAVSWLWDFGDGTTGNQKQPLHTFSGSGVYSVSLKVETAAGCSGHVIKGNSIVLPDCAGNLGNLSGILDPGKGFGKIPGTGSNIDTLHLPAIKGCAPFAVPFNNFISAAKKIKWLTGDGAYSYAKSFQHVYKNQGNYNVIIIAEDSIGRIDTITIPSYVQVSSVKAYFSMNQQESCTGRTFAFIDSSQNPTSWLWNFGNGGTSVVQNPVYNYSDSAVYSPELSVKNSEGCEDRHLQTSYFGPGATLWANRYDVCAGDAVTFNFAANGLFNYKWDFGDGTVSSSQNPDHTFSAAGNYSVTLTADNSIGCHFKYTLSSTILVRQPIADFTFVRKNTCGTLAMVFKNKSSGISQPANNFCVWDFGDGSPKQRAGNPMHTFPKAGNYTVTLTAYYDDDCYSVFSKPVKVDLVSADFAFVQDRQCFPVTVQYADSSKHAISWLWNFGDGTSSSLRNPVHTFNTMPAGQVSLTVIDSNGCTASISKANISELKARFVIGVLSGCAPLPVVFTGKGTNIASWLWKFGDGGESVSQQVSHIFRNKGTYTPTLIVKSSGGCADSVQLPPVVVGGPKALFSGFSSSTCAPSLVSFRDSSAGAAKWFWDFGDGSSSTLRNPSHIYPTPGSYSVRLVVLNNKGCSDTVSRIDYVHVLGPSAYFTVSDSSLCGQQSINFIDQSMNSSSWTWLFGDGSFSTVKNPSYLYKNQGKYNVSLLITDSMGCPASYVLPYPVNIRSGPQSKISVSLASGCANQLISFSDTSSKAISWLWRFGDGDSSLQQMPEHSYRDSGQFDVSLTISDKYACSSTMNTPLVIHSMPSSSGFDLSGAKGCQPYAVAFSVSNLNIKRVTWLYGDGGRDTLLSVKHTYTLPGKYPVQVIASTKYNCSDTFNVKPVEVLQTPVARFVSNASAVCPFSRVQFTDSSVSTQNATYLWNFDSTLSSTQQNPAVSFVTAGSKTISLIVSNNNGCSDTIVKPAMIWVSDSMPPPVSPLLVVTVSSNTTADIAWEPATVNDFDSYVIWRKADNEAVFTQVAVINNRATTLYNDKGLNTLDRAYCYKVETRDGCAHSIPVDQINAHCTINVTAKIIAKDNVKVSWTPYKGCSVAKYEIYRSEPGGASPQLMATVPSNILMYLDKSVLCPTYYSYRVKGTEICGNSITSSSDTSIAGPMPNSFADQKVEVVRSTVINNAKVYTEWSKPKIKPETVTAYKIYRSTDSSHYKLINTVKAAVREYFDSDVDVNRQSYYYRIEVVNSCGVSTPQSNMGSSILLNVELVEGNVQLTWSPYSGWNSEVEFYLIEKLDQHGKWVPVKTVDGKTLQYIEK
ncbi:MAG: PKD domain-containing protein [Bacteroidetes bacterium]|nr:PKD domain-containing protein [Bacteroidota bacterium]